MIQASERPKRMPPGRDQSLATVGMQFGIAATDGAHLTRNRAASWPAIGAKTLMNGRVRECLAMSAQRRNSDCRRRRDGVRT